MPKLIKKNGKYVWRLSYSEKEKNTLDESYDQTGKQAIRIVKAFFKFNSQNIFKSITSFVIKTSAMHLSKLLKTPQKKGDLGAFIFVFLSFLRQCLEKEVLMHYYDKKYNLLENTKVSHQTMISTIQIWCTNKERFYIMLQDI